ncbi:MAG: FG-GAP-like repeat-containing protein, partial [Planctomycetota bacterium]
MRILTLCLVALATALPSATVRSDVTFQKTILDPDFRSEGVAIADVNKDGKTDVIVGDLWYEAPNWNAHEIRKPRNPQRGGYTEAFAVYADDFNEDGWQDVLVIPFHGKDAKWYENPKGASGHWKERVAFPRTGNETRLYLDLFGDGEKVFLMSIEDHVAWIEVPPAAKINERWKVHRIAEDKTCGHRFAHGLGTGDVNGDGRKDILSPKGWWEQPAAGRKHDGLWKFHRTEIGNDCADMYVFDADGDGRNDIISTSAHQIGIWFHQQTGDPKEPTFKTYTLDKSIKETHSLNFIDVNGDGKKDLVTGWRFFAHGFRPEKAGMPSELAWFEILTTKGAPPTLRKHSVDMQSGVGAQFVTDDINQDGKLDIIVSNRKGVFVFQQTGKPTANASPTKRGPNFVVIFLDDSGWNDFPPFGKPKHKTPNVAKLANDGTAFRQFYVPQAICSASRAALLTGCYPGRTKMFGAHGPKARGLDPRFATIAEVLKPKGYKSAIFGKWHVGDQETTRPLARGFDENSGLMYSNDMWEYHPEHPKHWGRFPLQFWNNGKVTIERVTPQHQTMLTTWYTEHAVDFIA